MSERITIGLPEPLVDWIREQAAASNVSMSKFLANFLEQEMRQEGAGEGGSSGQEGARCTGRER